MDILEVLIGLVMLIVFAFLAYCYARLREQRKPVAPQVKGPTQRHMEDGHL